MWSPWVHALICCPPSCPFYSPPAMPSPFVHRQLKLLPCFSPLCMYQLLSNSGVLGQKHWISKPLEAPGTATSQTSTRYQLPTLSVPQVFLIHFGIVTVWNKREKEWSLQPFFFLLELVIYTNAFYFERARNATSHTPHGSADKQWLSKMQYISSSLSCMWHIYSLAMLLFRAMWQSKPK